MKEYKKTWQQDNKDRLHEKMKVYYHDNRERLLAKQKAYTEANIAAIKQYKKTIPRAK